MPFYFVRFLLCSAEVSTVLYSLSNQTLYSPNSSVLHIKDFVLMEFICIYLQVCTM